jgi:hypothetical protein
VAEATWTLATAIAPHVTISERRLPTKTYAVDKIFDLVVERSP